MARTKRLPRLSWEDGEWIGSCKLAAFENWGEGRAEKAKLVVHTPSSKKSKPDEGQRHAIFSLLEDSCDIELSAAEAILKYVRRNRRKYATDLAGLQLKTTDDIRVLLSTPRIHIPVSPATGPARIVVASECEWDPEHGLAVVFEIGSTSVVVVGMEEVAFDYLYEFDTSEEEGDFEDDLSEDDKVIQSVAAVTENWDGDTSKLRKLFKNHKKGKVLDYLLPLAPPDLIQAVIDLGVRPRQKDFSYAVLLHQCSQIEVYLKAGFEPSKTMMQEQIDMGKFDVLRCFRDAGVVAPNKKIQEAFDSI